MGAGQRLKDAFNAFTERREDLAVEMKIGETALKILGDAKLEARLKEYETLIDYFQEDKDINVGELRQRLFKMNKCMKTASVPYLRAGSNHYYSVVLSGWEELYALALNDIGVLKEEYEAIIKMIDNTGLTKKQTEEQKRLEEASFSTRLGQMNRTLNEAVFRWGFTIMAKAFFPSDVSAAYVNVIQSFSKSSPFTPTNPKQSLGER